MTAKIKWFHGPRARVASCPHCKFTIRVERGIGKGQDYGWRSYNKAMREMKEHIRKSHT